MRPHARRSGNARAWPGAVSNDRGFTLVELLSVVAIIGILSASAVMQFRDYKTRVEEMTQEQYFKMARKALEGRNDAITSITPGSYRYTYQLYNTNTWNIVNMSSKNDLIPGMPDIPNWMYFYIAEYNCAGQASSCSTQYIYSEDCRTGMIYYFNEQKNNNTFELNWYSAAVDGYC